MKLHSIFQTEESSQLHEAIYWDEYIFIFFWTEEIILQWHIQEIGTIKWA